MPGRPPKGIVGVGPPPTKREAWWAASLFALWALAWVVFCLLT